MQQQQTKTLNGKNLNKNNNDRGGNNSKSGNAESAAAATAAAAMVSRRRILSRSRDDLHMNGNAGEGDGGVGGGPGGMRGHPMRNVANYFRDEEDVWYLKEKLYRVSARKEGRKENRSSRRDVCTFSH